MSRWLIAVVVAFAVGIGAFWYTRPSQEEVPTGDAETRIIEYLKVNVKPGHPVYVTELYNNVFTTDEERQTLERLRGLFFEIPAAAVQLQKEHGRIPTVQELSDHFQFRIPGEMDVLLRIMESDPRVPRFIERDPATGEITRIDADRIAADERFR